MPFLRTQGHKGGSFANKWLERQRNRHQLFTLTEVQQDRTFPPECPLSPALDFLPTRSWPTPERRSTPPAGNKPPTRSGRSSKSQNRLPLGVACDICFMKSSTSGAMHSSRSVASDTVVPALPERPHAARDTATRRRRLVGWCAHRMHPRRAGDPRPLVLTRHWHPPTCELHGSDPICLAEHRVSSRNSPMSHGPQSYLGSFLARRMSSRGGSSPRNPASCLSTLGATG
jgi:hypothetical protein